MNWAEQLQADIEHAVLVAMRDGVPINAAIEALAAVKDKLTTAKPFADAALDSQRSPT